MESGKVPLIVLFAFGTIILLMYVSEPVLFFQQACFTYFVAYQLVIFHIRGEFDKTKARNLSYKGQFLGQNTKQSRMIF